MRQGQQNRRGRSRNRKGQNPLTRSFESNGPEIKIRGTPSHIAEKYISLARDALASGDPVLAENYLQHAEHYNRIIMTYREQQSSYSENLNGAGENRQRSRDNTEQTDAEDFQNSEGLGQSQQAQPDCNLASINGEVAEAAATEARTERTERQERSRSRRGSGTRSSNRSRRNGNGTQRETEAVNTDIAAANSEGLSPGKTKQDAFSTEDSPPDFLKRPVRRTRQMVAKASKSAAANDFEDSADKLAE